MAPCISTCSNVGCSLAIICNALLGPKIQYCLTLCVHLQCLSLSWTDFLRLSVPSLSWKPNKVTRIYSMVPLSLGRQSACNAEWLRGHQTNCKKDLITGGSASLPLFRLHLVLCKDCGGWRQNYQAYGGLHPFRSLILFTVYD